MEKIKEERNERNGKKKKHNVIKGNYLEGGGRG